LAQKGKGIANPWDWIRRGRGVRPGHAEEDDDTARWAPGVSGWKEGARLLQWGPRVSQTRRERGIRGARGLGRLLGWSAGWAEGERKGVLAVFFFFSIFFKSHFKLISKSFLNLFEIF